jgi:hypothetical protein
MIPFLSCAAARPYGWHDKAGWLRRAVIMLLLWVAHFAARLPGTPKWSVAPRYSGAAPSRRPIARLAPRSRGRHPPLFRDSERCFQASCGRAAAGRPEDCRSSCKFGPASFAASSASRKPNCRDRPDRPSGERYERTAASTGAVAPGTGSGTDMRPSENRPRPATRRAHCTFVQ